MLQYQHTPIFTFGLFHKTIPPAFFFFAINKYTRFIVELYIKEGQKKQTHH